MLPLLISASADTFLRHTLPDTQFSISELSAQSVCPLSGQTQWQTVGCAVPDLPSQAGDSAPTVTAQPICQTGLAWQSHVYTAGLQYQDLTRVEGSMSAV